MAAGGIKPGLTLGQTDDFGFNATDDRVHVHDLPAMLVPLLGFDHTKLTCSFQDRDFHLADVLVGEVEKMLARGGPNRPNSHAHD